jgi:hypothetical protein
MLRMLLLAVLLLGAVVPALAQNTISVCASGCDHSTIQAAINAAATGDVINVGVGSYTQNLTVNKSLTINGPNSGTAGFAARVAEAELLNGKITISGTVNVVIDGLRLFTAVNTATDLILVNSTSATVAIRNNRLERAGTTGGVIVRGIVTAIGITTPVVIEDNYFTGDISGGLFSGHVTLNNGIFTNGGSNILIKGNKFHHVRTALNVDNMSAGVTILDNIFEENGTALSFGGTQATTGSYSISGNSFAVFGTIANLSNVTTAFRLDLTGNTFDGKVPADLTLAERFNVERALWHRGRSNRNGMITFVAGHQFVVTQNPSIQNAVNYCSAGSTIRVEAGTYAENLVVNKSVALHGANVDVACGARGPEAVINPASGLPVHVTSNGVTLNGFEITAPGHQFALLCGNTSDLTISYNSIHHINSAATPVLTNTHAIQYTVANAPAATSNVAVLDNCISQVGSEALTGWSLAAIGFLQSTTTGTLTGLTVARNTISDVVMSGAAWPTGKVAYGIQLNAGGGTGYMTTTGKIVNAVIQDNVISGLSAHIATAIALEGNTENATVTGNTVTNLAATKLGTRAGGGLDLQALKFENNKFVGTCSVSNNNFSTNTFNHSSGNGKGYAIANYVPSANGGVADVSCNWLGSATPFEVDYAADLTSGRVFNKELCATGFLPWLTSAGAASCDGVPPVHNLTTNTYFTGIQGAINQATAGDVIEIAAGAYAENLTVNKSLTLMGPNSGIPGDADRTDEATILNSKITISGTVNVVIDGLRLFTTVNSATDLILVNSTSATVAIRNNRIERAGTVGGVIVRGVVTAIGITTPVVIENNYFTGDASGGLFGGHMTLNNGIFTNGGSNIQITGNTFHNVRTALNVDNMSAGVSIVDNVFVDNGTAMAFGGTTPASGQHGLSGNSFKVINTIANLSNVTTAFRLDLTGNTFDGKVPAELTLAERFSVERTLFHRGRSGRNGMVTFVSGHQFVVVENPSLQTAVDYSNAGGIVQVENVTFTGNVTVNKALDIRGANYNVDANAGTRGAESVVSGTFLLQSSGISVNGFEVTGAGAAFAAAGSGPWSNISLTHNRMIGKTGQQTVAYGFSLGNVTTSIGATNWTLSNNRIADIQAADATAMALFNITGLTVANNTILHTNALFNGRRGMNLDGCQDVTVSGNTVNMGLVSPASDNSDGAFTKARYPLQLSASAVGRSVSNVNVTGNSMGGAYDGIITLGNGVYDGITITGNTISNNVLGVRFQAGTNGPVGSQSNITIENNTISTSNRCVYLQNGSSGGTADPYVNVSITSNSLQRGTSGAIVEMQADAIYAEGNLNATNNHWGACPVVSGPVTFYPYWANVAGTAGSLVFSNSITNINASASPTTVCAGQSSTLTGLNGSTFNWGALGAGSTKTVNPTETTTYSVTGNDLNNCAIGTATVTVAVAPAPTVSITADGNELTASGAASYVWSTGETTPAITVEPEVSTTYSVIGSTAGCTSIASYTVEVFEASAGSNQTICNGTSATLQATPTGAGYTYLWSNGATTSSITVSPMSSTVYTVTINGSSSASAVVFVQPKPTANAGANQLLVNGNATLGGSATGGSAPYTYAWSGAASASVQNPVVTVAGTYSLVVTDAFGCSSTNAAQVEVTAPAANTYVVSGSVRYYNALANQQMHNVQVRMVCQSGDCTPGAVYSATTPATGLGNYSISNMPAGSYTVYLSSPMAWGGVTSTDVSRINNHVTGLRPMSGIYLLAADVSAHSASALVTTADRDLVNAKRLNPSVLFPTGDWVFTRRDDAMATSNYAYAHGGSANDAASAGAYSNITITVGANLVQDFVSLCYGDVDASNSGLKAIQDVEDEWFTMMNFPNPFATSTTIRFDLPVEGDLYLEVFDLSGARVASRVQAGSVPGIQDMVFDASHLADGLYLYRLTLYTSDDILRQTNRMMIAR